MKAESSTRVGNSTLLVKIRSSLTTIIVWAGFRRVQRAKNATAAIPDEGYSLPGRSLGGDLAEAPVQKIAALGERLGL